MQKNVSIGDQKQKPCLSAAKSSASKKPIVPRFMLISYSANSGSVERNKGWRVWNAWIWNARRLMSSRLWFEALRMEKTGNSNSSATPQMCMRFLNAEKLFFSQRGTQCFNLLRHISFASLRTLDNTNYFHVLAGSKIYRSWF